MMPLILLVALIVSHVTYFASTGRVQMWSALASCVVQIAALFTVGGLGPAIGAPAFGVLFGLRLAEVSKRKES